jgi:hypothetical protein
MSELDTVKEIFLSDVDEETLSDNLQKINEWESQLRKNNAYIAWREHGITEELNKMIKSAYKEHALQLATNRSLSEEQRMRLWAKQDACLFILELTNKDAKSELNSVLREIRHAINATNGM